MSKNPISVTPAMILALLFLFTVQSGCSYDAKRQRSYERERLWLDHEWAKTI